MAGPGGRTRRRRCSGRVGSGCTSTCRARPPTPRSPSPPTTSTPPTPGAAAAAQRRSVGRVRGRAHGPHRRRRRVRVGGPGRHDRHLRLDLRRRPVASSGPSPTASHTYAAAGHLHRDAHGHRRRRRPPTQATQSVTVTDRRRRRRSVVAAGRVRADGERLAGVRRMWVGRGRDRVRRRTSRWRRGGSDRAAVGGPEPAGDADRRSRRRTSTSTVGSGAGQGADRRRVRCVSADGPEGGDHGLPVAGVPAADGHDRCSWRGSVNGVETVLASVNLPGGGATSAGPGAAPAVPGDGDGVDGAVGQGVVRRGGGAGGVAGPGRGLHGGAPAAGRGRGARLPVELGDQRAGHRHRRQPHAPASSDERPYTVCRSGGGTRRVVPRHWRALRARRASGSPKFFIAREV